MKGSGGLQSSSKDALQLDDPISLSTAAQNALDSQDWRTLIERDGIALFNSIFVQHPAVLSTYRRACRPEAQGLVHITLETHMDLLPVPFEFMRDPYASLGAEFLALLHPMSRSILGIERVRKPFDSELLNSLSHEDCTFRVLVIGSNTTPDIPGVDAEVTWVSGHLRELFVDLDLRMELTPIPTHEATLTRVEEALQDTTYHIVHYAGHGRYSRQRPQESGLPFWRRSNSSGGIETLSTSRLNHLLKGADVRLVFLSCCYGGLTADASQRHSNAFLGLTEAIVRSGVPSVIGFRSGVSDAGAVGMTSEFYRALAKSGDLDAALYAARGEFASKWADDPAWLSAMLIHQT